MVSNHGYVSHWQLIVLGTVHPAGDRPRVPGTAPTCDQPGWRTPYNRGITELRPRHGRWSRTWRDEHDSQVSGELASDRDRRAGRRVDGRLWIDRPRERDRDQRPGRVKLRPSLLPVHARERRPELPGPRSERLRTQQHRPPVAGRPERNERVHALPAPVRAPADSTGERAPPGTPTRELHARERRPELPRPECARQYPVPHHQPHSSVPRIPARIERAVQEAQ